MSDMQQAQYESQWLEYEAEKAAWIAKHPDASDQEYETAIREIIQRCGV